MALSFILILIFTWLTGMFLPWWTVVFPSFIISTWLLRSGINAFAIGFSAAGLAWFLQALYIHIANEAILSTRIADMMQAGSPWVVLIITLSIGGILGGFAAFTGYLLKDVLNKQSPSVSI